MSFDIDIGHASQSGGGAVNEDFAAVVLDRLIGAQNTWLAAHNRRRAWARDSGTALCALTALVLRGQAFTVAHAGDTRVWLLRDSELRPLTQDHVLDHEQAIQQGHRNQRHLDQGGVLAPDALRQQALTKGAMAPFMTQMQHEKAT